MSLPDDSQREAARILVAEDDILQRQIIKKTLASHGYDVEVISDGLDAVWKIRCGRYDLALIDYDLPEIDGLATARLVRDLMGEAARPRLLAYTAAPGRLTDREAASERGFDAVVAKSANWADLISGIEHQLSSGPDRASRRAAESDLLLQNWMEYDADPARRNAQSGRLTPPRILVVEDDDLQQLVLRSALETRGYIVEIVSDGLQAVRMIRGGAYDLVLVDYQLPEIDGLAAARLILDLMNEDVRPRMVALTSMPGQLADRQEDTGVVFDEVVEKSPDLLALLGIVDRQLRSAPSSPTRRAAERMGPPIAGAS